MRSQAPSSVTRASRVARSSRVHTARLPLAGASAGGSGSRTGTASRAGPLGRSAGPPASWTVTPRPGAGAGRSPPAAILAAPVPAPGWTWSGHVAPEPALTRLRAAPAAAAPGARRRPAATRPGGPRRRPGTCPGRCRGGELHLAEQVAADQRVHVSLDLVRAGPAVAGGERHELAARGQPHPVEGIEAVLEQRPHVGERVG